VIPLNSWTHIAYVAQGATMTIYINGVSKATGAWTTSTSPGTNFYVGFIRSSNALRYLNGYISNFRYVNGAAVYTDTFTTPTSPLLATQPAGTNISAITGTQTSLLLSTPVNSITTDYSLNALTVTNTGGVTTSAFSPFGVTSPDITFTGFTINMTSATAKTFAGGGGTYPILSQGGAGALTITGSNSFEDIQATAIPSTITFAASSITTVSEFTLAGTEGNLVTINSSIPGTQFTLYRIAGITDTNYLSIQDSSATTNSGNWLAGTTSVNVSNNTGWKFSKFNTANFLFF
jgi:hypothetical protein